jgi:hypothetical protein
VGGEGGIDGSEELEDDELEDEEDETCWPLWVVCFRVAFDKWERVGRIQCLCIENGKSRMTVSNFLFSGPGRLVLPPGLSVPSVFTIERNRKL